MLQKIYTQAGAAHGSVQFSVKRSNLLVSNVRQLFSKASFSKSALVTINVKKMKTFIRVKNCHWCTDLAYVYTQAKKGFKLYLGPSLLV